MIGVFGRRDALKADSIKGYLGTPRFLASVASKGLRRWVSSLDTIHTPHLASVASKGLIGLHNYRSGGAFLALSRGCGCFAGVPV
jgi:hypothetical protein